MIHISSSVVLSQAGELITANNPRIGYHNIITADNISADEEATDEPVRNLANPATYLYWRGETTNAQTVQVSLAEAEEVNYFAIAKHNLGSTGATVAFEYSNNGSDWTTVETVEPSSDYALIVEFDAVSAQFYRLNITPGSAAPAIAVLYVGQILVLQRRIYVGHTPITFGRKTIVSNGRSENGQFLGRVMRREFLQTGVDLKNITPSWYRNYMDPFVQSARTKPFFFAWRPQQYPNEVGFAWLTNDVDVSNQLPNGYMQLSMKLQGVR